MGLSSDCIARRPGRHGTQFTTHSDPLKASGPHSSALAVTPLTGLAR
jgi:hypothetical protein